jgi:hypothetical protein
VPITKRQRQRLRRAALEGYPPGTTYEEALADLKKRPVSLSDFKKESVSLSDFKKEGISDIKDMKKRYLTELPPKPHVW